MTRVWLICVSPEDIETIDALIREIWYRPGGRDAGQTAMSNLYASVGRALQGERHPADFSGAINNLIFDWSHEDKDRLRSHAQAMVDIIIEEYKKAISRHNPH